jgi:hypothetical protein
MLSRRQDRRFSKDQLQLHKGMGHQLKRANALAAQRLLQLNRLRPDQRRYEQVYSYLAGLVRWINFLTGCCERIVANGWQQRITRCVVRITTYCKNCRANGRYGNRSTGQGEQAGTLEADPAWEMQVHFLLHLTTLTVWRTFGRACSSPSELKKFPQGLADLTKALLRQLRHLEQMGTGGEPEVVVIEDRSEICSECGHRKKDEPLTGDNASSPGIP